MILKRISLNSCVHASQYQKILEVLSGVAMPNKEKSKFNDKLRANL